MHTKYRSCLLKLSSLGGHLVALGVVLVTNGCHSSAIVSVDGGPLDAASSPARTVALQVDDTTAITSYERSPSGEVFLAAAFSDQPYASRIHPVPDGLPCVRALSGFFSRYGTGASPRGDLGPSITFSIPGHDIVIVGARGNYATPLSAGDPRHPQHDTWYDLSADGTFSWTDVLYVSGAPPVITQPAAGATLDITQDLEIAWVAGDAARITMVLSGRALIICGSDDTGTFTVPAEMLANFGTVGPVQLDVYRVYAYRLERDDQVVHAMAQTVTSTTLTR